MKKVSIIDVAKHAGVSVSTVSLVLRQKGKISEATIEKVNAAITTLGYVHNVAAANLRANTSNLIALAKLYGISAEELLKSVEHSAGAAKPNEGNEKTV